MRHYHPTAQTNPGPLPKSWTDEAGVLHKNLSMWTPEALLAAGWYPVRWEALPEGVYDHGDPAIVGDEYVYPAGSVDLDRWKAEQKNRAWEERTARVDLYTGSEQNKLNLLMASVDILDREAAGQTLTAEDVAIRQSLRALPVLIKAHDAVVAALRSYIDGLTEPTAIDWDNLPDGLAWP
jgi:hypothetical protein